MCIAQLKPGTLVIETAFGQLPIAFAVATCTVFAQGVFVLVVLLVAGITVFGRFFEHGTLVTLLAFHFGVLTQQWKSGRLMVKFGRLFPATLCMATAAVLT